ncbi:hypothetical protein [Candidatus Nitrotoga arctica]|uniref:Uncharacterized protein n=1 Tax=Candidatus Nitrotoga arctica TaxID=453162 RepID=A0ABM8YXW9_9PROT|nr:hypothetical protein [Candidatus Nitrotoga arctica]CAG9932428.1 conserved protein of unknown function [Candidatus Nitrotoga arctica]
MMKNSSTRKSKARTGQTGNVHERIQSESKQAKKSHSFMPYDADETPALAALLTDAFKAVIEALPTKFEMEGRVYWVRCSIGLARVDVFDNPTTSQPLIRGIVGNQDAFGHNPVH